MHDKRESSYVIHHAHSHSPQPVRRVYRCQVLFKSLYQWLRKSGVTGNKPLHTLRKEFGSEINRAGGLYAAMTALRHTNISTTADHYTDNKRRNALPVADLLRS